MFWFSVIYVSFVAKHVLADFIFQTDWMWRGKERHEEWLAPLAAHAACHAGFTLALALLFGPRFWWLALADFLIHGLIDKGKVATSNWLKLSRTDAGWWWLFGIDQAIHQLTHFAFVLILVST